MKLLLDTHTLLWFIAGSPSLSSTARIQIEEPENQKFVSIASIWEIAIKVSTGKMSLAAPRFSVLSALPFHHRDPFDRLLIAQSIVEEFAVVTIDSNFVDYPRKTSMVKIDTEHVQDLAL